MNLLDAPWRKIIVVEQEVNINIAHVEIYIYNQEARMFRENHYVVAKLYIHSYKCTVYTKWNVGI